ncbi:MAG TPA: PAS domain-containing sensor histidine kinase [Vicinamibacterales bacterium]
MTLALTVAVSAICLAHAIERTELALRRARIEQATVARRDELATVLRLWSQGYIRLAERLGRGLYPTEADWHADAHAHLRDSGDPYASIQVYDDRLRAGWSAVGSAGIHPSRDGLATAMVEARSAGTPIVMPPIQAAPDVWTFRLAAPIPGGGLLVASHSIAAMLDPLYERTTHGMRLVAGDEVVYHNGDFPSGLEPAEASLELPGTTWRVLMAPDASSTGAVSLPRVVIVFGLLLGVSFGGAVHLARTAAARARREEQTNATLALEIAERTRIEAALRDTMGLQRGILDSANYIILSLDRDGTIRTFNRAAERLLGRAPDQLIGHSPVPFVAPDDLEVRAAELSRELGRDVTPDMDALVALVAPGRPDTREWMFIHADGTRFPVELSISAMTDAIGTLTGYVWIAADISSRRHADLLRRWAEESLRRTEELLHSVLDSAATGIVAARALRNDEGGIDDFEILLVNPAAERMLGAQAPALVGLGLRRRFPEDGDAVFRACVEVVDGRHVADFEQQYQRDGVSGWFRIIAAPLGDGITLSIEDITRRKQAEADLAQYVADLERSRDQIHEQSVVLQWQAEELMRARDEALAGTREMERALKIQADFVSFASHQLRTPLAGIKWLLELALDEPDLGADLRSWLEDSRQSVERLISLVNDLLDIARLEGGRVRLSPAPHDLAALCREVAREVEPNAARKHQTLRLEGADTPLSAVIDGALMRQVLLNLLSNAVKYTPDGGTVWLRLACDGPEVRCVVEDTGIGVPEAARARLFEKFFRADNVQQLETEGTGLGLFMARLILEKLGGRIWYEPRGDGTGSRFICAVPVEGVDVETDTARRGRPRAA